MPPDATEALNAALFCSVCDFGCLGAKLPGSTVRKRQRPAC
jgi:hypothetical protein